MNRRTLQAFKIIIVSYQVIRSLIFDVILVIEIDDFNFLDIYSLNFQNVVCSLVRNFVFDGGSPLFNFKD